VSTNLGAIYETCAPFAKLIGFNRNFDEMQNKFKGALLSSIDNFWSSENQKKMKLQIDSFPLQLHFFLIFRRPKIIDTGQ
jgi:hypothetical protein